MMALQGVILLKQVSFVKYQGIAATNEENSDAIKT